jgi:hypothetical protein
LASWRIIFASNLKTTREDSTGFSKGNALGEQPDGVWVSLPAVAGGGAHNVVVKHAFDTGACVFERLGQKRGAEEVLFFACYGGEDDCGVRFAGCENAGEFDDDCS